MAGTNDLERRIGEKLAANEEGRRRRQDGLRRSMTEMEERLSRYTTVADRLMEAVILPRVAKLADGFRDVQPPEVQRTRHSCVCRFEHSPRFPATATLELSVTRDGEARNVAVESRRQILPVFYPVNGEGHFVMPLDGVDEQRAADWVDEQVLAFVDAYLKLETIDHYQDENLVADPVCGMRINKTNAAAEMEYRGVKYYFCVEQCRRKFAEDPGRYVAARPGAAPARAEGANSPATGGLS
jgi:YHS domain-containing protein